MVRCRRWRNLSFVPVGYDDTFDRVVGTPYSPRRWRWGDEKCGTSFATRSTDSEAKAKRQPDILLDADHTLHTLSTWRLVHSGHFSTVLTFGRGTERSACLEFMLNNAGGSRRLARSKSRSTPNGTIPQGRGRMNMRSRNGNVDISFQNFLPIATVLFFSTVAERSCPHTGRKCRERRWLLLLVVLVFLPPPCVPSSFQVPKPPFPSSIVYRLPTSLCS